MFSLEVSKMLWRDHQMMKKDVENKTKLRTRSKGKGFKNLLSRDERKLKGFSDFWPVLSSSERVELRESRCTKGVDYFVKWDL